jgi:two-component system, chemotaxis family, protein-glutamate methylesterase/glutaminase
LPARVVLVVEREKILSKSLKDYFEYLGLEYQVLTAGSIAEATDVLATRVTDLVVTEHQGTAGANGLELLRSIRGKDIPIRVVLVADEHLVDDRKSALMLGCSSYVVQPVPETRLLDLIFNMLQPFQGFAGRLVGMRLEDVIQMFCYRKESTLVTAFNEGNEGSIYVNDGGIIHAQCDTMIGVEAFYEILGWETGEFYSQVVFTVPEQTVFMDWQTLLMEGIRQKDEIRHALGPVSGYAVPPVRMPAQWPAKRDAVREGEESKRIMIVDDSRFIRKIVYEIIRSDSGLIVAGYAANGQEALAKIDELKPDLILLDWDMPVMKGSTTLMHIMIRSPCPVVVLSGFVGGVGANPFDLLCLGGVDFLRKPQSNWRMDGRADDLVRRVKEACALKFDRIRRVKTPTVVKEAKSGPVKNVPSRFLTIMGSFIGGCPDLIRAIPSLPGDLPSAVVVVHDMQQEVIGAFVDYLDRRSRIQVRQLESGAALYEGVCYIHPASAPVELAREGDTFSARMISELPGEYVIDHFLTSASKVMGQNLLAILLSGGSGGGIDGLRAVKQVDGITMVQDPASSVDPRLAETAIKEGLVDHKCSADTFSAMIRKLIGRGL